MKKSVLIAVTTVVLVTCYAVANSQSTKTSPVTAKGATVNRVASDYRFTEGPAVDPDGNVFFTDQPNDKILKWSAADGSITVFMEGAGRSNGLYFDTKGNLLSCADLKNELWRIGKDKNVTVLVSDFEGKKLNGPNDLWVHPSGGIYFTDPFYKRDYWNRTEKEIEQENVYYLSPDGSVSVAATGLVQPNGIVGTSDGKRLYVADIGDKKTYSYAINNDGTLSDRKEFVPMGSDGMTIDQKGNVYLTGKGVTIFNASGEQIDHIDVDAPWTANVCFGGKDRKTLFITASTSVYTLKMKVAGAR
jgi:gluconolactonase